MSYRVPSVGRDDSNDTADGVFGRLRSHVHNWSDRYVQMRVEAHEN